VNPAAYTNTHFSSALPPEMPACTSSITGHPSSTRTPGHPGCDSIFTLQGGKPTPTGVTEPRAPQPQPPSTSVSDISKPLDVPCHRAPTERHQLEIPRPLLTGIPAIIRPCAGTQRSHAGLPVAPNPDPPRNSKRGPPRTGKRKSRTAMFSLLNNGARWKHRPPQFRSQSAVHRLSQRLLREGVFERPLQEAGRMCKGAPSRSA